MVDCVFFLYNCYNDDLCRWMGMHNSSHLSPSFHMSLVQETKDRIKDETGVHFAVISIRQTWTLDGSQTHALCDCLVKVVLKRTVVGDLSWAEVTFRVKWTVFVSRSCYNIITYGSLKVIGQFCRDDTGWTTLVKFVSGHWSVSKYPIRKSLCNTSCQAKQVLKKFSKKILEITQVKWILLLLCCMIIPVLPLLQKLFNAYVGK